MVHDIPMTRQRTITARRGGDGAGHVARRTRERGARAAPNGVARAYSVPRFQGPRIAKVTPGDCTLANSHSPWKVAPAHSREV